MTVARAEFVDRLQLFPDCGFTIYSPRKTPLLQGGVDAPIKKMHPSLLSARRER